MFTACARCRESAGIRPFWKRLDLGVLAGVIPERAFAEAGIGCGSVAEGLRGAMAAGVSGEAPRRQ